jgi:hypothetical protein
LARANTALFGTSAERGQRFPENQAGQARLLADFGAAAVAGMVPEKGENGITTQVLSGSAIESRSVRIAALALPFLLIAPAQWNGYPLLQWDTGGYLAR